jgi:signal-transduction protein with cAMP-binding, CBS, and nucleotidyltransferase domain
LLYPKRNLLAQRIGPMKTSVIRHRVADFLKSHAPFDALSEPDLLDLAGSGRVKFHTSEEYLFRQHDAKGQFVWIIQQGRVELLEESTSGEQLRDVLGEGDLVGLERFSGNGACPYSARTATDVIVYGIVGSLFESLVPRYPALKRFLAARVSPSGILAYARTSWLDAEAPSIEFLRARPLHTLATVGPCVRPMLAPLTTRAAVREMLRTRSEEIMITADGTLDGRLEGILTASDLALFCGHNPIRLVSTIRHAGSTAEMIPLLHLGKRLVQDALAQPLDVDDCCGIGTEVVAAAADACIRLACADVHAMDIAAPGVPSCWVLFGVSARGELLGPALPAIAVVYDDSAEGFRPEDSLYFAALGGKMAEWFHACGLAGPDLPWPEGSGTSMPLSEWRRLYCETIRNPIGHDLYARREFFDLRQLSGDTSIFEKMQNHVLVELHDHEMAIALLANDTLVHLPPLTFFRGLVLELDGAQRNSFDIASTAVSPIADAARVFAIAKRRLAPSNTLERLETAALDFPEGAAILREAADAFRTALYYQAQAGGSRVEPGRLGKFDQILLKTAFVSIQRLLEFTTSTFIPAA